MHKGVSSKSYLAFDLGAESGRAMLIWLHSGTLTAREVRRFKNEPVQEGGSLRWNVQALWHEMRAALSELDIATTGLAGVGVDTWGVDYALLDETGTLLENPYHYRDPRTGGMMERVFRKTSKEEIYNTTGIQFMPINTLYQLFAANRETPSVLKRAKKFLTIPDLFHFWLSGKAVCEFTNATTTQLINPKTRAWARELIAQLELPAHLWGEIVEPGTLLGELRRGITTNTAFTHTPVIAPAAHDTGSAVAAISARQGTAFLSSGTWSLLGSELDAPVITPEAMRLNFTNEGGVNGTTRFLKNVMGLWMLQGCHKAWAAQGHTYDLPGLLHAAEREEAFSCLVDPDHESFLRSTNMPAAITEFCLHTHQPAPKFAAGFTRTILESLAFKYRVVLVELEQLTGKHIETIRVIGGGSKNRVLNQFTADATGKTVLAGPAEATALGNAAVQMLATGAVASLQEARAIIESSYPVEVFRPVHGEAWNLQAERFRHYCEAVYA
jgi:rhamnulokinase